MDATYKAVTYNDKHPKVKGVIYMHGEAPNIAAVIVSQGFCSEVFGPMVNWTNGIEFCNFIEDVADALKCVGRPR